MHCSTSQYTSICIPNTASMWAGAGVDESASASAVSVLAPLSDCLGCGGLCVWKSLRFLFV